MDTYMSRHIHGMYTYEKEFHQELGRLRALRPPSAKKHVSTLLLLSLLSFIIVIVIVPCTYQK